MSGLYYLTNLDEDNALTTVAAFAGVATTAQTVTYNKIQTGTITRASMLAGFTFNTDPVDASDSVVGAAKNSGSAFTHTNTADERTELQNDYMKGLARQVFGSVEAVDYFSNTTAMETSIDTAIDTTALGSINASTNASVCKELVDTMLANDQERFALEYGTALTGTAANATYTNVTLVGTTSTAECLVDIVVVSSAITSIVLKSVSATGTPFQNDEEVKNTTVFGTSGVCTWAAANPVIVAMMNGTLDGDRSLLTGAVITTGYTTAGTYRDCLITGNNSGATTNATVHIGNNGGLVIKEIYKTGATTGTFTTSDIACTVVHAASSSTITLGTLATNADGVTYLNSDTTNTPIAAPIETGDIIYIKYTLQSNASQTDTAGSNIVNNAQTFYYAFTVN